MKHLTPIEWLIEELKGYEYDGDDFIFNGVITSELIEEVKAMEKEQIVEAWDDGNYAYFEDGEDGGDFENGKEYYDNKYKTK